MYGICACTLYNGEDLPADFSLPFTGQFCMQHAGWKTSEKAISVELLQDFTLKSLFNTLFMMFNSRYQGFTVHRVLAPNHPAKDWPNVLYIKG
jgi:hypothetical protein